jgi:hypothetical protein
LEVRLRPQRTVKLPFLTQILDSFPVLPLNRGYDRQEIEMMIMGEKIAQT